MDLAGVPLNTRLIGSYLSDTDRRRFRRSISRSNMHKKLVASPSLSRKCPTGVRGFDEITEGGIPRASATLICGEAGSGKTLLAMEILARGASQFGEPGLFVAFEESPMQLKRNLMPLGFDIERLIRDKKLSIEPVRIERRLIREAGDFDLEPLFIRLANRIKAIKAKRVVLDSVEALFAAFSNTQLVRAELSRLLEWFKAKGLTVIVTGERGSGQLTRHGIEEYVSDCVVLMEQAMSEQVATRYLRIPKYRGSRHGTNQYPFLIDGNGILVVPITSLALGYRVSRERVSTGIAELDRMLGGRGVFRGSTILISGSPGTGKSSVAASFADAACARGERVLYASFEESEDQIIRNMKSIGLDLARWTRKGLLRFHCVRPHTYGLEGHLASLYAAIAEHAPHAVVVDPISDFDSIGPVHQVRAMLTRLTDHLKAENVTAFFTSLVSHADTVENTEVGISSVIDTWLLVRNMEDGGERNRALHLLKSRGMPHSNQVREFLLTERGIDLVDVYVGPDGILTGSRRAAELAHEGGVAHERDDEVRQLRRALEHKRRGFESRIQAMRAEFGAERDALESAIRSRSTRAAAALTTRQELAQRRQAAAALKRSGRS
jgi:circadian clock protein KaiC